MSLCVSLSPLFPQGAPEWKDKNFNFKRVQSAAVLAEGKTRNKAFRVVEARSGRYDKKKVTCIKKTCTDHARLYLTTQASSFIPFDLSLSVFLARQKEYFTIILHEIWWRATQPGRQGGGEHHTFGACDRCQSSAIFSSFLCFSGRFTSSSTRLAIPPVSMSFLPPRVAFAEGGERLGEMGSWPVVRPSGAAPKPMLANKKVGLMTEKVELTWGLSATRFADGGRWARCRIPAMRPDWVESSMY